MNGRHVTAHFAGFYLGYLGVPNPPTVNTIRTWAWRGKVVRVGTDEWGYALYDLTTILDEARRIGYLATIDAADTGDDACM